MYRKIFSLMVAAAALALFGAACETIPDDDAGKVEISLAMMTSPEKAAEVFPQEPGHSGPIYHVKITLTNPNETFYAFNWTPPEPIILMVAASGKRVINAEVYEVYKSLSPNYFPATLYSSAWMPAYQRTVDLAGEGASISLFADYHPYYGNVGGGSEVLMSDGNTYIPLEFYRSCPPPDQFYTNLVDLDWGGFKIFPTVPLSLWGGSYPTFQFHYLPAGHKFQFEVYHATAGTWTRAKTYIDEGMNPVNLKLGGYADPWVTFDPESISAVRGEYYQVFWELLGGWGSVGERTTTPSDTCYGMGGPHLGGPIGITATIWDWFNNPYEFSAPAQSSCLIDVRFYDCRGTMVPKSMTVPITVCNEDDNCEYWYGETNGNCPSDCFCGDGYCNPPEDEMSCATDCYAP